MGRDVLRYMRITRHLTDWLMDNFDNVIEEERIKLTCEIMYYKLLIKALTPDPIILN